MNLFNLLKNNEIKLVEKRKEFSGKYSFLFESTAPLNWKAGQHGIFTFKKTKLNGRKFRLFSVASSPDEKIIKIATNIDKNPSDFKAHLQSMQIGDSMYIRGPFGNFFVPKNTKKIVLIAGGIGITPMRAILKDLESNNKTGEALLFYIDSKKEYLFQEELDKIKGTNVGL